MGVRLYLPSIGRFLQVDPVEGANANDYKYSNQDPINNSDLNGKWCIFGFIGDSCTRYVTDRYGRSIPVQAQVRDKIRTKHNISWSTLQWLLQRLPSSTNSAGQTNFTGTI